MALVKFSGIVANAVLTHREGRLYPMVADFLGSPKCLESKKYNWIRLN